MSDDLENTREWAKQQAVDAALYDAARRATDDVMGEGTYAEINGGNPDPRVQAAIERGKFREPPEGWSTFGTHVYIPTPLHFSTELDEAGMPLWERPLREVEPQGPCALCGTDPAAGYASIWTSAEGEKWYCHGDHDESPTCYEQAQQMVADR